MRLDIVKDDRALADKGSLPDPDAWEHTPNPQFGWREPADLIGTPDEPVLRNLLRAAKSGMAS